MPHARLHDFRHTFGASLAQQGVPVPAIKELMGHSRITSTQIHIHFGPIHLQGEIAKLPF
jgi:integrase/recombinase XerD